MQRLPDTTTDAFAGVHWNVVPLPWQPFHHARRLLFALRRVSGPLRPLFDRADNLLYAQERARKPADAVERPSGMYDPGTPLVMTRSRAAAIERAAARARVQQHLDGTPQLVHFGPIGPEHADALAAFDCGPNHREPWTLELDVGIRELLVPAW